MIRRLTILLRHGAALLLAWPAFGIASAVAATAGEPVTMVTAVRLLEADPAYPQVLVELGAHRDARLFTLVGPDRVVLDIPAADADAAVLRETLALTSGGDVLRRIRVGRQSRQVLRLVLDTSRAVSARLTTGESEPGRGARLLVTLGPKPDAVAARRPAADAPLANDAPSPAARRRVVVIDAGHGGSDLGSLGRGGTREKDVTLALAQLLAARIDATPGWQAVLTRVDDSAVAPAERARRAALAGASLWVSLQANAAANPDVAGAAVYVYDSVASSPNAAWLAEREAAEGENAVRTAPLVSGAAEPSAASRAAAEAVVAALRPVVRLRHDVVQRAPLASLRDAPVPAILVDVACLSNREDERRARSEQYGSQLAEAIARALAGGADRRDPSGTAPQGSMWAKSR